MPATSAPDPARSAAVDRLLRVQEDGAFVARLGDASLDADAARRASDFVAGVTRHRRWLDFLLGRFYRGDLAALDPVLHAILSIGAYDLVVRQTAPHAAVNEAVGLASARLHRGAAGLTNAVLRALARAADRLPEPDAADAAEQLAVRHSHPTWMVRRWLDRWGIDATRALLVHNNAAPHYGLRANTRRLDRDVLAARIAAAGGDARLSAWLDDGLVTQQLQPVLRAGLVRDGSCAVQDEAAALVVRVLDPQPGEAVLDAASAPGGKALYAATRMDDRGTVTAVDLSARKLALVERAAAAHGLSCIQTRAGDLRDLDLEPVHDRVLLDAPCSGSGVLAKRADLRWRRQPHDLDDLAALQDRLLDAVAGAVRPGGLLVYSTCSIEPEENEDRVGAFLERHPEFAREPVGEAVPPEMRTARGDYAALPHVHGTDGAFAARLRSAA